MNDPAKQFETDTLRTSDAQLLARFVGTRCKRAFSELVLRYSELVMTVCYRVLRQQQDAEDAFQETFVVLAKRASKIRHGDSVSSWLYGTAYRVSLELRKAAVRRREVESSAEVKKLELSDGLDEISQRYEQEILDHELSLLDSQLRAPLVLHYFCGMTCHQIGQELSLTKAAVESRLRRGRARLKRVLLQRGIALSAVLGILQIDQSQCAAALSQTLIQQTVDQAVTQSASTLLTKTEIFKMNHLSGSFLISSVAALTIILAVVLWAPLNHNGNASADTAIQIQTPNRSNINRVHFRFVSHQIRQESKDDETVGALVKKLMALDGGSVLYEFKDDAGNVNELKIDNSFAAQKNGTKGTMYLNGIALDAQSKEGKKMRRWIAHWNRPKTYKEPAGTLIDVGNGVSFTRYTFVDNDKTAKVVEVERKDGTIKAIGGAVIQKDSKAGKQIRRWLAALKPGQLFSMKKNTDSTEYVFLDHQLRRNWVTEKGDKLIGKYGKEIDQHSETGKRISKWLKSWKK